MASKETLAISAQKATNNLVKALSDIEGARSAYFSRGYDSAGSDPIVDGDISMLGISAVDLAAFVTMATQLLNFTNNVAVTQADYQITIDNMRTDV